MTIRSHPVTIIDGLEGFTEKLLKASNENPWRESKEDLSGNSYVIPMSKEVEEFGLCIGQILGLNLHDGFVQHSKNQYFIKKHNHANELHATYVLFYLWSAGDPGKIELFDPNTSVERATGRMIVIPEKRYHSVNPISGENIFIRFVFTSKPRRIRCLNKTLINDIRSKMKFKQA